MKRIFMDKKMKILLCVVIILLIVIVTVTATYAAWVENPGESKYLRFGVNDENASVKYQIYVPIDAQNNIIKGSLDILNREYTLDNPEDINLIEGYALVGWNGGISFARLEIPSIYTMIVNGELLSESPLSVLVTDEYSDYLIAENSVITEIEIPQNIVHIDNGAFMLMASLEDVVFTGIGEIHIGKHAFDFGPKEARIDYGRRTVMYVDSVNGN